MEIWVADDQQADLVADIQEYQRTQLEENDTNSDVKILGVSSLDELQTRVDACALNPDTLPDMIFLDLSFTSPEDGIEALKHLKFHECQHVRNVPVVMYSQSDNVRDVYVTISWRANAYMTKESGLEQFWEAVKHWRATQFSPHNKPAGIELELPTLP